VWGKRTPSSSPNATISMATSSRRALRGEALDDAERGERAERAVVAAGVAHGVDMRTDHQRRRVRPPAFVARADVADRIDARRQAALSAQAMNCSAARRCDCDRQSRVSLGGSSVKAASASSRAISRRAWLSVVAAIAR
jgi:hypothetical protein